MLVIATAGCGQGSGGASAPVAKPPPRTWSVVAATLTAEPLSYRIDALGQLEADETVDVAAEVDGVLGPLAFREGDRVTTATALVEIDPVRYRLALERSRAGLARAEAQLKEREATLSRRAALRERSPDYVPEEEWLRLEAEVLGARAALAEARVTESLAATDLARSTVRPPIAGEIERRLANAGQFVRSGTPIAAIVKRRPLRLRFSITEEESARVTAGIPVEFEVPAYPRERFRAVIFFVARTASERTRRVDCIASYPNDDERLKPGFFARASIRERAKDDAILVPESAVLATEKGFVVYTIEGGKTARRRRIEPGLRTPDGRIEAVSGLAAGEVIAVRGAGLLDDGVPVTVEAAARPERAP